MHPIEKLEHAYIHVDISIPSVHVVCVCVCVCVCCTQESDWTTPCPTRHRIRSATATGSAVRIIFARQRASQAVVANLVDCLPAHGGRSVSLVTSAARPLTRRSGAAKSANSVQVNTRMHVLVASFF